MVFKVNYQISKPSVLINLIMNVKKKTAQFVFPKFKTLRISGSELPLIQQN